MCFLFYKIFSSRYIPPIDINNEEELIRRGILKQDKEGKILWNINMGENEDIPDILLFLKSHGIKDITEEKIRYIINDRYNNGFYISTNDIMDPNRQYGTYNYRNLGFIITVNFI